MRLLVAEDCGFIGSNFIRYMLKKYLDYEVVNLDKFTYVVNPADFKNIEANLNYSSIKSDRCDSVIVNEIMKKADKVVHFVAESHVDRSIDDGSIFVRGNVLGTSVLLQSALANKIKKFSNLSTDKVYRSTKEGSFTETDNLNPSSPYP
ncbi:GDP-mannose 4,6-dehydratase [Methanosarcina vacuolata]|uniref:dTDP-glucose 4,6-dehydratase n=1 Tax=Methanosarcina vacuolata Z-761 TaxID=1434123 RepID=A0A0E3Q479_9EURY|nr:GDP-mannose 4,6-dehydratase [Methanosarcina vacuolata]AKB43098.1 dTDP-glucose 4,6-dehydratase [Methanosarcina vacuolata Z-761]